MKNRKILNFFAVLLIVSFFVQTSAFATPSTKDSLVYSKVAVLHTNPIIGDVESNLLNLKNLIKQAFDNGANFVVAPELATTGYSITREQVNDGLGFEYPYPQLDDIQQIAIDYKGYIVLGIAEVAQDSKVYNTAVVFGPQGIIRTQDKRSMPTWNDRGVLPFETVQTPYGDLGVLICSDSYHQEWPRVLTLEGADILLMPANWWGDDNQLDIWRMRAKENGVWLAVANRWGYEVDDRYGDPYIYDMKDAPSAIINEDGEVLQSYKSEDNPQPKDMILYQTISVPKYKIGTKANYTYSVAERRPSAYGEIANNNYDGYYGYKLAEGLPIAGKISVANLSYKPSLSNNKNIQTIENLWAKQSTGAAIVVLPGLGITPKPIASTNKDWFKQSPFKEIQKFVESNSILLLVSTVTVLSATGSYESLILIQPGKSPQLVQQIHDCHLSKGSGSPPFIIDILSARIGILTGHDSLFPETTTHLAKAGVDILLISSTVGVAKNSCIMPSRSNFWDINDLKTLWENRYTDGMHVIASDWTGNGIIMKNSGWNIEELKEANSYNQIITSNLDTSSVRDKYLSAYYSFDLNVLLTQNVCTKILESQKELDYENMLNSIPLKNAS